MSADRLDVLLDLVRDPGPRDDAFVSSVMARARSDAGARTGLRALAVAAAILLAASAGAALRVPAPPARPEAAAPAAGDRGAPARAPAPDPSRDAGPSAPALERDQTARSGSLEWGRPRTTTAYAVDHETGLRLDVAVERAEVDAGVPQRVTLKLRNTGTRAISVASRGGCALAVGVYDAAGAGDPQPRRCAAVRGRPQESAAFVLAPGAEIAADATVVLAGGSWELVGMCDCAYGRAGAGSGPGDLVDPLTGLGSALPGSPVAGGGEATRSGLATPPILVRAA